MKPSASNTRDHLRSCESRIWNRPIRPLTSSRGGWLRNRCARGPERPSPNGRRWRQRRLLKEHSPGAEGGWGDLSSVLRGARRTVFAGGSQDDPRVHRDPSEGGQEACDGQKSSSAAQARACAWAAVAGRGQEPERRGRLGQARRRIVWRQSRKRAVGYRRGCRCSTPRRSWQADRVWPAPPLRLEGISE